MKNTFITEAETVNAGPKFIIRDIVQQVGEKTETMCLDELEAKQRERVWTSSLERRRSAVKRLSHLYRSVLLGLCLPLTNYLVSFSTPELPWDPLLGTHAPLSQDGSQSEGF